MKLINSRTGIEMFYNERGEGKPHFVLIHGWTGNHTRWGKLPEMLSVDHHVIDYDLRGHSRSEKNISLDYGFSSHVMDLLGLLDVLSIDKAVICGHSMGGMIAQNFALAFPERVEKLVLVATASCMAPTPADKKKLLATSFLFKYLFKAAMFIKNRDKADKTDLFPDMIDDSLSPISKSASDSLVNISKMDLRERVRNLHIPTLVITTDTDKTINIKYAKEPASLIPGTKYVELKGLSHHIPLDDPDSTFNAIENFINE